MDEKTKTKKQLFAFLGVALVVSGIVSGRMLLHDANFTPVIAFALLSGFLFRRRLLAFGGVFLGMLLSDLFLPFDGLPMRFLVYLSLALSVFLGAFVPHAKREFSSSSFKENYKSLGSYKRGFAFAGLALSSSFLGALLFYLFTNAGVWAWSGMYAHTIEGLGQCYLNALPFFRNTLASTLLFGSIFLGMARLLQGRLQFFPEPKKAAVLR